MKVLFAVSNENISRSIIKKYQQTYKEIISGKNVYYFNAILKELQKDKTYDRIVISEDLEPFTNNNFDTIDNFIFDKLDSISDEASNNLGEDIPIILIATDRRTKSDDLLVKLFGIGIYSTLIGQDRSIEQLCNLINKPRTKKEAKVYYQIDSNEVEYKAESEGNVSEIEIQNILNHYKRLGRNEEKYVESFNSIAAQYTDAQLKLIIKFLPLNVKAVLEANSPKYQELMAFSGMSKKDKTKSTYTPPSLKNRKEDTSGIKVESILQNKAGKKLTKPVIIPSTVSTKNVKKVEKASNAALEEAKMEELKRQQEEKARIEAEKRAKEAEERRLREEAERKARQEAAKRAMEEEKARIEREKQEQARREQEQIKNSQPLAEPKRKRGRPRKVQPEETTIVENVQLEEEAVVAQEKPVEEPKRKRGRPRKVQVEEVAIQEEPEEINLFGLDEIEDEEENVLPGFEELDFTQEEELVEDSDYEEEEEEEVDFLPGFEEEEYEEETPITSLYEEDDDTEEFDYEDESQIEEDDDEEMAETEDTQNELNQINNRNYQNAREAYTRKSAYDELISNPVSTFAPSTENLLTKDKKIVSFVGTSKNGTSFLVNNVAELLSSQGIRTAILDLTKNKNAYYIYTKNEEELRKTAFGCMKKLTQGIAEGIKVNRSLDVYTCLPGEEDFLGKSEDVIKTLLQNYALVLIDCDFDTEYEYLNMSQEIYLVQSMDVLTIQPLTAYLRNLKAKGILVQEKLRVVINKSMRVRSVTERTIIGGMAFYNDPAMSFMTELFNRETVKYASIPFDVQVYSKYLEGLVNCSITLNGYSKEFMAALRKLAGMVYPLINSKNKYNNDYNNYNSNFSNDMNNTLDKMKGIY